MREIKFRAWDKKTQVLNRVTLLGLHYDLQPDPPVYGMSDDIDGVRYYSDVDLMQYTSLKDKNGVEIYEGDIVEYDSGTKAKVIFKEGCFVGYDGYATSSDEAYLLLVAKEDPFGPDFRLEVIGNIYENPDLLESK